MNLFNTYGLSTIQRTKSIKNEKTTTKKDNKYKSLRVIKASKQSKFNYLKRFSNLYHCIGDLENNLISDLKKLKSYDK